tara:strand:+ start:239 stop:433 length:195 start_codon:yes stop_codon:yes gene_type:complete
MTTYNHLFSIMFAVVTKASCEDENDWPTAEEISDGLERRFKNMGELEIIEAVGEPHDTYIEDED